MGQETKAGSAVSFKTCVRQRLKWGFIEKIELFYIPTLTRLHQPPARPRVPPCKDFIVYTAASDKSCPDYPKSPTAAPPASPRVGWPRNAEQMLRSDWPTGRQLQEAAGCMGIIDRGGEGGTFKVGALHLSSSTRGHNFQGCVNCQLLLPPKGAL